MLMSTCVIIITWLFLTRSGWAHWIWSSGCPKAGAYPGWNRAWGLHGGDWYFGRMSSWKHCSALWSVLLWLYTLGMWLWSESSCKIWCRYLLRHTPSLQIYIEFCPGGAVDDIIVGKQQNHTWALLGQCLECACYLIIWSFQTASYYCWQYMIIHNMLTCIHAHVHTCHQNSTMDCLSHRFSAYLSRCFQHCSFFMTIAAFTETLKLAIYC